MVVNGNSQGAVSTYTFTNVTADGTIVASFSSTSGEPPIPEGTSGNRPVHRSSSERPSDLTEEIAALRAFLGKLTPANKASMTVSSLKGLFSFGFGMPALYFPKDFVSDRAQFDLGIQIGRAHV